MENKKPDDKNYNRNNVVANKKIHAYCVHKTRTKGMSMYRQ